MNLVVLEGKVKQAKHARHSSRSEPNIDIWSIQGATVMDAKRKSISKSRLPLKIWRLRCFAGISVHVLRCKSC